MWVAPRQYELPLCGGVMLASKRIEPRRCVGIRRCKSPLETSLAMAFSALPGFQWRLSFADEVEVGRWQKAGILLLAQSRYGPYWADFCLRDCRARPDGSVVVVEVDGHDYHERSKVQAQRDHMRDRYMVERGAAVLRFTGREVWQNARECASEVWSFAGKKFASQRPRRQPVMAAAKLLYGPHKY
jgi:very-short-patch-repair endonuclease